MCMEVMLPSSSVVTAAPTLSGEAVLTPFHPYGTVRHIQNKPVKKFTDRNQFLLIAAAEKEGLLKVKFKVSHVSKLEKSGSVLYYSWMLWATLDSSKAVHDVLQN